MEPAQGERELHERVGIVFQVTCQPVRDQPSKPAPKDALRCASPRVPPGATSVPERLSIGCASHSLEVRQRGVEPPHPIGHGRLRTACLPFHHCRGGHQSSSCSDHLSAFLLTNVCSHPRPDGSLVEERETACPKPSTLPSSRRISLSRSVVPRRYRLGD